MWLVGTDCCGDPWEAGTLLVLCLGIGLLSSAPGRPCALALLGPLLG